MPGGNAVRKPALQGRSIMEPLVGDEKWIYVLVRNGDGREQVVGQYDAAHQIKFIPAFLDRDTAQQGAVHMAMEPGAFEIQAMIFEDLVRYARDGQSLIFILDARGAVLSKLSPDGRPL